MSEADFDSIDFALTRDEYAQAVLRLRSVSKRFGRKWPASIKLANLFSATAGPVLLLMAIGIFKPVSMPAAEIFFLVFCVYAAFWVWLRNSAFAYRWVPLDSGSALRPHSITVSDDGLFFRSTLSETLLRWGALRMVDDHAGIILLLTDRSSAQIVPRRGFPSPETADRFVALLELRIAEAASIWG